jgi:hypothetical protein
MDRQLVWDRCNFPKALESKPHTTVKHCLDFFFVFSPPLPAWRNLFSARFQHAQSSVVEGPDQPGCTGIFWPTEGASQPVTISKKWKNPSSSFRRERTWVQALLWFSTYSLGLPAWDTDLKSREGPVLRPFSYT